MFLNINDVIMEGGVMSKNDMMTGGMGGSKMAHKRITYFMYLYKNIYPLRKVIPNVMHTLP